MNHVQTGDFQIVLVYRADCSENVIDPVLDIPWARHAQEIEILSLH